jgi:hypothetical protein
MESSLMLKQRKKVQTKIYMARSGAPFKAEDAQEIGKFVESVQDKSTKGILEAVRKDRNCILHAYIEWDNKEAAEEFRLQQIRNIVNHITIEITQLGDGHPVRAFYSINDASHEDATYVNVESVFSNTEYRNQVIERAKSELRNWMERYKQYSELSSIVDAIKRSGGFEVQE